MKLISSISALSLGLLLSVAGAAEQDGESTAVAIPQQQNIRGLRLPDCIFSNLQLRRQIKQASTNIDDPTNIVFCDKEVFTVRQQFDLTGKSVAFSCADPEGCRLEPRTNGIRAFYGSPAFASFQDLHFKNFRYDLRPFARKKRWCDKVRGRRFLGFRCPEFDAAFETLGGAMFFTGGIVELNDLIFTENTSLGAASGVSMTGGGTLTIRRPIMSENRFRDLYTGEEDRAEITGLFRGGGGAVYVSDSTLNLVGRGADCIFQYNQATYGGAVFAQNSVVDINGCIFFENEAANDGFGGAIFFRRSQATLNNTYFKDGVAFSAVDPQGDDIYIDDDDDPAAGGSNIMCMQDIIFCANVTENSLAQEGTVYNNTNCDVVGQNLTEPICNLINENLREY